MLGVAVTKFEQRCGIIVNLSIGRCPTCGEFGVSYWEDEGTRFYWHTPDCGMFEAQMFRGYIIIDATEVLEDV